MCEVIVPPAWRQQMGGVRNVNISGDSVGELLVMLAEAFPEIRHRVFTPEGTLHVQMNVCVNDEMLSQSDSDRLNYPVNEEDTVFLIPAMAGGS